METAEILNAMEASSATIRKELRKCFADFESKLVAYINSTSSPPPQPTESSSPIPISSAIAAPAPVIPPPLDSLPPQPTTTLLQAPTTARKKLEVLVDVSFVSKSDVGLDSLIGPSLSFEPLSGKEYLSFSDERDNVVGRSFFLSTVHPLPGLPYRESHHQLSLSVTDCHFSSSLNNTSSQKKNEKNATTFASRSPVFVSPRCLHIDCSEPIPRLFYGRALNVWDEEPPGSDEGLLVWVVANYALGTLGAKPAQTTGNIEFDSALVHVAFISNKLMSPEFSPKDKFGNFMTKLQGKFLAIENFFHTSKFFKLHERSLFSGMVTVGEQFFGEDWSNLKQIDKYFEQEDLITYCFTTTYIVSLLHDSLGIVLDNSKVEYASEVHSIPLDWALGASIWQSAAEFDVNNILVKCDAYTLVEAPPGIATTPILQYVSYKMILLVLQDKIGGRIHKDYSFGCPVDLGDSWLHGVCHTNFLFPINRCLGLTLYSTRVEDIILYNHDLESYTLSYLTDCQVPQNLVTEVRVAFKKNLEEMDKVRNGQSSDMSVKESILIVLGKHLELRQEGLAYEVWQWYSCRMKAWFAANAELISLRVWDQEQVLTGDHGLMILGYDPVIKTLTRDIDIRSKPREKIIIIKGFKKVKLIVEDGRNFVDESAIVPVPWGILKAKLIELEPELLEWKLSAISDLGIENVFWPNLKFLGIVANTSYVYGYFLNICKATGHSVLVYMVAWALANDIEKLFDEAVIDFVMLQLKRMYPDASDPVPYEVSRWGTDSNNLGCYLHDAVGDSDDRYDQIHASVGNILFGATSIANIVLSFHWTILAFFGLVGERTRGFLPNGHIKVIIKNGAPMFGLLSNYSVQLVVLKNVIPQVTHLLHGLSKVYQWCINGCFWESKVPCDRNRVLVHCLGVVCSIEDSKIQPVLHISARRSLRGNHGPAVLPKRSNESHPLLTPTMILGTKPPP